MQDTEADRIAYEILAGWMQLEELAYLHRDARALDVLHLLQQHLGVSGK